MPQIDAFQMEAEADCSLILVVVLLLLLPPVLVELMDFNGHVPQLSQVKSLKNKHEKSRHIDKIQQYAHVTARLQKQEDLYLINFTKTASSQ